MADDDVLDEAIVAIRAGEVIALATDTVYGLGVRANLADACERVFALKGRPESVALPVLVSQLGHALALADQRVIEPLDRLGRAFWPGALSIVVPRAPEVRFQLGGDESTIALRIPANERARVLIEETGPLAVTSANRHGAAPCTSAQEVRAVFGDSIRVVIDDGVCDGQPSTVISIVDGTVRCFREGPIPIDALARAASLPIGR